MRDLFLDPEDLADMDWHDRLSFQETTFLAGLLVKQEITLETPTAEDLMRRFDRVYALFEELHKKYGQRFIANLSDDLQHPSPTESAEENFRRVLGSGGLMAEPIFYSASGAYDFQYLDFAIQKYKRDEAWIVKHAGLSVSAMVAFARELKNLHERKFHEQPNVEKGNFFDLSKVALEIFCFGESDLSHLGRHDFSAFVNTFSVVAGQANQSLTLPGQYNALHSHPIVKLPDSRYFLPVGFNLSESIYESPFYWMIKDGSYASTALEHRGVCSQEITAGLLRTVFGDTNVYAEVKVEGGKGHTVTDIDVLATCGNKAIICQVKSKRLTELSKLGDDETLVVDFEKAVQDAYNQALLSRQAVINKSNRLFVNGKAVHLNEQIDDAYILCITLDNYPAITHQVDVYLKKKQNDPYPIAINIFDLDILTFYLKDPFEFLYYLRQRVSLADYYKADSEISVLAFHIKYKLFRQKDVDFQALEPSIAQLIDANFPVLRGSLPRTSAIDKLYPDWKNEDFSRLIEQVKATGEPGFTEAIFLLYDLAGRGADKLIEMIKLLKRKALSDHKSHDARIILEGGRGGLTIVVEPDSPHTLQAKLLTLAKLSKYRSKADIWLALGSISGSPNFVDAIAFQKSPWKEDAKLEQMVADFFPKPRIKMGRRSQKKIGRNDRCPCGSGQKFKKCHGA